VSGAGRAPVDGRALRRAPNPDDRQLQIAVEIFDVESSAGIAGDERMRQCTRRTARPLRARFDPQFSVGREALEGAFVGRAAGQGGVRAVFVIPVNKRDERWAQDWVPQHATIEQAGGRPGVLQLVPRSQHTPGSPFWSLFHPLPNGGGGYVEWAIPAGAPPN
jgi:hypothetical protein